ncbi:MAG: hypothetical protein ACXABY_01275 [Candidatus Thorarchaeota archaeon]
MDFNWNGMCYVLMGEYGPIAVVESQKLAVLAVKSCHAERYVTTSKLSEVNILKRGDKEPIGS